MATRDFDGQDLAQILLGSGVTGAWMVFAVTPKVANDGVAFGAVLFFVLLCHTMLVIVFRRTEDPKIVNTNHDLETHRRVLEEAIRQVRKALILRSTPLRLVQDPVWGYVEIQEARPEQVPTIRKELGLPPRVE